MKYNNVIFLGLCLGLTTYSALSADSVIKISGRVLDYGCTVSSDSLNDCPVETSAVTAIVTGSTDNTGYYKNEGTAENIQEAQKYPLAYIAQVNKNSHFIFRVLPLTVPDMCLLTQHQMQQKHRAWVSL